MKNLNLVAELPFQDEPRSEAAQSAAHAAPVRLLPSIPVEAAPLTEADLHKLIEPQEAYGRWIRIVILRLLLKSNAWATLAQSGNCYAASVGAFLGFPDFEKLISEKNRASTRAALAELLASWEAGAHSKPVFPAELATNLERLAEHVKLNATETTILGFSVLIHTESIIEDACCLLGERVGGYAVARIMSAVLKLDLAEVEQALNEQSALNRSGLASIDYQHEGALRSRIDFITHAFPKKMVIRQPAILDLINDFVTVSSDSQLKAIDYLHIQDRLALLKSYLREVLQGGTAGVNILVYGKPGTGKSEFARVLARELGCDLVSIGDSLISQNRVSPTRRLRSYQLAQVFFRNHQSIVLFDECEEVLSSDGPFGMGFASGTTTHKSWVNQILETNHLPTIWVSNSIENFDPAFIRRFCVCFEMATPVQAERRKMISAMFEQPVGNALLEKIARNRHMVPALIEQTARIVNVIGKDKPAAERDALVLLLVNDQLKAQGKEVIALKSGGVANNAFEPALINCTVNLQGLRDGIANSGRGRFCVYGPPGTGKTAFGRWIADSLAVPHLVRKGSDIMAPHVGETERNIAQAFDEARRENAVLQFDEVDSFLHDRNATVRQWEASIVNEMLTQMESFDGVFIASTNRFDHLDEASLRRFDMSLKFDYLTDAGAWLMFARVCESFGFEIEERKMKAALQKLHGLAPGDFEQVYRQGSFLKPKTADDVLGFLARNAGLKKSKAIRPMGFTA